MAKDIRIVVHTPDLDGVWDAFVDRSNNGTLFHRQAFLSYHGKKIAKQFEHLLFYRGETLTAVLPMGWMDENGIRGCRSPYGASFGGLVTLEPHHAETDELILAFLSHAKENGVKNITITPPPAIYHQRLDANLEFSLLRNGFKVVTRELCQVVDLRRNANLDLLETYAYSCDKQIRKAIKLGLSVRRTENVEGFHAMLEVNRRKHGVMPTHSLEDLRNLFAKQPESMILFGAYRGEVLEAGLLAMVAQRKVLLNFYTCSREEAQGTGADNLINHEALLWARAHDFHYYDFGTSSLGMQPNLGLIRFKESFGSGSILRDTYRWQAP